MATKYDPDNEHEKHVSLPSAPSGHVAGTINVVFQPPLTRRGTGPGLLIVLPPSHAFSESTKKTLDPPPIQKLAEEGFFVVAITYDSGTFNEDVRTGLRFLSQQDSLENRVRMAIIAYVHESVHELQNIQASYPQQFVLTVYGPVTSDPQFPVLSHVCQSDDQDSVGEQLKVHKYETRSPFFVLPQSTDYNHTAASLAHTRTLEFFRKNDSAPGPFDLEALWEEHCYYEFELRSLAKTMATMVAEPYVNNIPTMTGGIGRENLTAFYRDHFIFLNPPIKLELVSRTIGSNRLIDEFVTHLTHTTMVDWLLPGVPPTGRKLAIPMMGVISFRGDRLFHEHIWWDQGTALLQAGVLPSHVPYPLPDGKHVIRLPIAGAECARLLVDETDGESNEMMNWGVQEV